MGRTFRLACEGKGHACAQCLRIVWNLRFPIFVSGCVVMVIVVLTSYSRPPHLDHNKPGQRLASKNGFDTRMFENLTTVASSHTTLYDVQFTFSRSELRMSFKPFVPIGSTDLTYDNDKDFICNQLSYLSVNTTDDIMCYERPMYLEYFKNPCYEAISRNPAFPSKIQCLPYFHVLGSDKCGTTDFHSRLTSHPLILKNDGGLGKETYFWSWLRYGLWIKKTVRKWPLWAYPRYFFNASVAIVDGLLYNNEQLITGDATPMDFWDFRGWQLDPQNEGFSEPRFLTPHAMRHLYKDPKFFLLFRNPTDRLYSDYVFLGYGFTAHKFARDVPRAIDMMRSCLKVNTTRQCFFSEDMYQKLPMRIHVSCYSIFLREWLSVFSRQHFLILRTEDYHSNMKDTLKKTFQFLQVPTLPEHDLDLLVKRKVKHETKLKKKAGPMFPETRLLLDEFFYRFNQDLSLLLNDTRFMWTESSYVT